MKTQPREDQQAVISDLVSDLASKALSEAGHPVAAVSALMAAAADILCLTFPPEVAASLMTESTNVAIRTMAADLLTVAPSTSCGDRCR